MKRIILIFAVTMTGVMASMALDDFGGADDGSFYDTDIGQNERTSLSNSLRKAISNEIDLAAAASEDVIPAASNFYSSGSLAFPWAETHSRLVFVDTNGLRVGAEILTDADLIRNDGYQGRIDNLDTLRASDRNRQDVNDSILAFKVAAADSLAGFGLSEGWTDDFVDETNVADTNLFSYDASGNFYEGVFAATFNIASALVMQVDFEDTGSATNIADTSTNGATLYLSRDGTPDSMGGASIGVNVPANLGRSFSNFYGNSWAESTMADAPPLGFGTGTFAVSYWLNSTSTANGQVSFVLGDSSTASRGNVMMSTENSKLWVFVHDLSGNNAGWDGSGSPSGIILDGAWHHVVINRSNQFGIAMWIDGVNKGFAQNASLASLSGEGGSNIVSIGADHLAEPTPENTGWGGSPSGVAQLDHVQIFNRSLSSNEIVAIYNSGDGNITNIVADASATGYVETASIALATVPSTVRIVIRAKSTSGDIGLNTDLVALFSSDDGTTDDVVTLAPDAFGENGTRIYSGIHTNLSSSATGGVARIESRNAGQFNLYDLAFHTE